MVGDPYYNKAVASFTKQCEIYPCVVSRNGLNATVIRSPDRVREDMEGNNYVKRVESNIDILRTDFATLNLSANSTPFIATVNGEELTYRFSEIVYDDENEPTLTIRAQRVIGTL